MFMCGMYVFGLEFEVRGSLLLFSLVFEKGLPWILELSVLARLTSQHVPRFTCPSQAGHTGRKHEVWRAQNSHVLPSGRPQDLLSPTCSMSRMMLMLSSCRKVREQGRLLSCPDSCRGERPSEAWAMVVLVA